MSKKKKHMAKSDVSQKSKKDDSASERRTCPRWLKNALMVAALGSLVFLPSFFWLSQYSAPNQPASASQNSGQSQPQGNADIAKAAILDGLYDAYPNVTWTRSITNCLLSSGYSVDLFSGTNVTIDLLRSIHGYKILILRMHSAVHTDGFLYLFSGEHYSESKYIEEQRARVVWGGLTFNHTEQPYFALNAVLLGKIYDGLNGSTIILMGCNGTSSPYSVQRLFEQGVKQYISWNGYVDPDHSDQSTLALTEASYAELLGLEEAVKKVNREIGPDPYGSTLVYYAP
ncbi:hypothetical protein MUP37_05610 [Candidatus Bathyarchaeota archaeon]|nr:hypothetical protein [Candidatus Bathyarchaeota archaeon]